MGAVIVGLVSLLAGLGGLNTAIAMVQYPDQIVGGARWYRQNAHLHRREVLDEATGLPLPRSAEMVVRRMFAPHPRPRWYFGPHARGRWLMAKPRRVYINGIWGIVASSMFILFGIIGIVAGLTSWAR